jgi:hypothetical protein
MSFKNYLKGMFKPKSKEDQVAEFRRKTKERTQQNLGDASKRKPKYTTHLPDVGRKPDSRSEYDANRQMKENLKIDMKDKPIRKYLGAKRGRTKTGNSAHAIEIFKENEMKNDMASVNAEIARRNKAQRTVVSRYLRLTRRTSDD